MSYYTVGKLYRNSDTTIFVLKRTPCMFSRCCPNKKHCSGQLIVQDLSYSICGYSSDNEPHYTLLTEGNDTYPPYSKNSLSLLDRFLIRQQFTQPAAATFQITKNELKFKLRYKENE